MVDSTISALWVPVIVFSHIFALVWFVKVFQLNSPSAFAWFKRKKGVSVGPNGAVSDDESEGVELEIKAEDIVLTLSKQPPARPKTDTKQKHDQVPGAKLTHGIDAITMLSMAKYCMFNRSLHPQNSRWHHGTYILNKSFLYAVMQPTQR